MKQLKTTTSRPDPAVTIVKKINSLSGDNGMRIARYESANILNEVLILKKVIASFGGVDTINIPEMYVHLSSLGRVKKKSKFTVLEERLNSLQKEINGLQSQIHRGPALYGK